jgi:molybdopterin/thiamine biosynthesis adenylyltransferase
MIRQIVDVREAEEFSEGHLPGAISVPLGNVEEAIREGTIPRDRPLTVICARGGRAARAAVLLAEAGFDAVVAESHMDERDGALSDAARRYSRQMRLPGVGRTGQEKLKQARVVVVGAGGLGSPVALYLAAAGVGTITLIDGDRVEGSNLHRQILHDTASLGRPKVESGAERLLALNPESCVRAIPEMLTATNAAALLTDHDLVIDGSDNFAARYAINDACILHRIPWIHGSVHRMSGQLAVFAPGYACYRCLFPSPTEGVLGANCAEAGVLGGVVGILGSMLATEALKHLLGLGAPLVETLVTYDALRLETQRFRFGARVGCICSAT